MFIAAEETKAGISSKIDGNLGSFLKKLIPVTNTNPPETLLL